MVPGFVNQRGGSNVSTPLLGFLVEDMKLSRSKEVGFCSCFAAVDGHDCSLYHLVCVVALNNYSSDETTKPQRRLCGKPMQVYY